MLITKPIHKYYAFQSLTNSTYVEMAETYSSCKRYGFRAVVLFCTGTNTIGILKEISKGVVVQYGKRRFATVVIGSALHICAPAIAVITNATKVVKTCKIVYTTTGYIIEAFEDAGTLGLLPLDFALFGQPIPTGTSKRYSNWDEIEDVIKQLPVVGDGDD